MATHPKMNDRLLETHHEPENRFITSSQLRAMIGLILVALGGVFLLGQTDRLDYGSNWWIIFIFIPGVVFLWAAFTTYQHVHHINSLNALQAFVGVVAIVLSLIFIVDPHWSFTRNWNLNRTFPFLKDIVWDRIWPWFLVLPGIGILYRGFRQHSVTTGFWGGALVVVGVVFLLNISWDLVWPLAIVAVGLLMLFELLPARNKAKRE